MRGSGSIQETNALLVFLFGRRWIRLSFTHTYTSLELGHPISLT